MSLLSTVQSIYGAFGRGDVPFILSTLSPHVEWTGTGMALQAKNATFRGRDSVASFFQLVKETEHWKVFSPDRFVESKDGKMVVVFGHADGSVDGASESAWLFTHVFEQGEDGLIHKVEAQWRHANGSSSNILAIVQSLYSAFGKGDIPFILAHCAPNIEWVASGLVRSNLLRTFHGVEGVAEFFSHVGRDAHWTSFVPQRFIVGQDGNTVVVTGEAIGTVFSNPSAAWWFTHLWQFNSEGKLVRVEDQWRVSNTDAEKVYGK